MKNWKTFAGGLTLAIGQFLETQPGAWGIVGKVLSIVGAAVLGASAKDSNVTGGTIKQ